MKKVSADTKPFYNSTIPSDWKVMELGKIFKLTSGKTKPAVLFENPVDENIYPVYGGNGIMGYASEYNSEGEKIIIGRVGEYCGVTRFLNELCWITDNALLTKEFLTDIDIKFLAFKLQQEDLSKLRSKGGQPLVSQVPISIHKIVLPKSLPEQKAIAKVLSLMDEAINKNNRLITQKELRKKWLMQNLLTGKKRLNGFNEEWKEKTLIEIFERVTRKNTERNSNVVTISAQRGFVKQTDFFNKSIASEILDNYFLVYKGEFCYNKSYANGYDWGATKRLNDFDKAVVTTLYICFGIKDLRKTDGDFFEQYFEANFLDRGLTKIAHEGGRAHGLLNVTPSDFFSLKICVPDYDEQKEIAKILKAADKEIQLLKTKTEKLNEQKKWLMQVLLTGKKRLSNQI